MTDGILPVIKPVGMRSMEVVDRIKHRLKKVYGKKVKMGHTGTLDRMAAGMFPLCIGKACKFTSFFTSWDKEYVAHIVLGKSTKTHDIEGEVTYVHEGPIPDRNTVVDALSEHFMGEIMQVPPIVSAVRVKGRRAHEYFYDDGKDEGEVEIPPRKVFIYEMQIIDYKVADSLGHLFVRIRCSKGTYIRAIARDLGKVLGTGGYMHGLVRTITGPFKLDGAVPMNMLWQTDHPLDYLVPIEYGLRTYPEIVLSDTDINMLRLGRGLPLGDEGTVDAVFRVKNTAGMFVGLAEMREGVLKVKLWL